MGSSEYPETVEELLKGRVHNPVATLKLIKDMARRIKNIEKKLKFGQFASEVKMEDEINGVSIKKMKMDEIAEAIMVEIRKEFPEAKNYKLVLEPLEDGQFASVGKC